MYIKCDRYGFFFVASRDYDSMLDIQHSHRPNDFEVKFTRQIEPGIIKIFDFNIQGADKPIRSNVLLNGTRTHYSNIIRMLSLRDDEFLIDEATYPEEITQSFSQYYGNIKWFGGGEEK